MPGETIKMVPRLPIQSLLPSPPRYGKGLNMTILDLLTLLSYIALNVDIVFQIKRIYQTKSSRDLSLTGMIIRYAAIVIILIKFIGLSDVPLIIGQGLIVLTFGTYFALALYYFAKSNSRISGGAKPGGRSTARASHS